MWPWILGCTWAIALLVNVWCQVDPRWGAGFRTALIYIGVFFIGLVTWLWLVLGSSVSRKIRIGVVVGSVLGLAALLGSLRLEEVTGGLIPKFRFVWQKPKDTLLEQLESGASDVPEGIDLVSVTTHDFPQFLGPNRDLNLPNVELNPDWNLHPPEEIWRKPIGAGWSAFAAVNGFAVTMEQRADAELTTCYSIETGEIVWSNASSTRHHTVMGGAGPRSTPLIYNGFVYTVGATGVFRCLDGRNGQERWSRNLLAEYGISQEADDLKGVAWGRSCSPLAVGNRIVVAVGGPAGRDKASLLAVDHETGETIWQQGNYQVSYASPVLATLLDRQVILHLAEDRLVIHDAESGEALCEYPWPGNSAANASASQPVAISGNHVFLSKGYGHGSSLISISQSNGQWQADEVWHEARYMKTKFTNVVRSGDYIYGLDDIRLECLRWESGELAWKGRNRYGYGQILRVGSHLLVMAESGELALVELTPDTFKEIGRIPALNGKTWNNLCLFGDRLLVRNAEEAACYRLHLVDSPVGL
ncbi:MAG: PQQ-binding-like beta-propeller repeat protein [Planctomycetales bacterium]|nr:PQQ-binding-like beta-propeller repeat protein [Planctomycetales bacterium]